MDCSTPGLPVHHQLPELAQSHVHRVGDAIQPSHPLSSLFLLSSIFPSIRVFSSESALHVRWPRCWSFSFNISPSKEYSGLISFRMDWLDLLAVQETLKSLLQHHSSKASILWCSAFFFFFEMLEIYYYYLLSTSLILQTFQITRQQLILPHPSHPKFLIKSSSSKDTHSSLCIKLYEIKGKNCVHLAVNAAHTSGAGVHQRLALLSRS